METKDFNWEEIKHIHFVGIKGVAMTALAVWAKEKGFEVTGSDVREEFPTDEVLKKANIYPSVGFLPDHVSGDVVIYTGAHGGRDNIEVKEAVKRNIPVFPHGQALGMLMDGHKQISIAGCHGKTTTTAMIATVLSHAGMDPSYAIGCGLIRGLGLSGHAGKGAYFIAEADEYVTDPNHDSTPRFLWQHPETLVITAIDFDHPDVYKNIDDVGKAYVSLTNQMSGEKTLIFNADDKNNSIYLQTKTSETYGFDQGNLVVIAGEQKPFSNTGVFVWDNEKISVTLQIPGKHNLLNAAAAFLVGKKLGIETEKIIGGLKQYAGASRRFEYIGEKNNTVYIDDYAHHPAEIKATLMAAREWYPDHQIICLFQPHTYSRTAAFLSDFGSAFYESDTVGILPIYASAREIEKTIDAEDVVKEIKKHDKNVSFYPSIETFFEEHSNSFKPTVILFLGAGDIGRKAREFIWIH